mgnify:CR=1 FL=1
MVSRSRMLAFSFSNLLLKDTVMDMVTELVVVGVVLHAYKIIDNPGHALQALLSMAQV